MESKLLTLFILLFMSISGQSQDTLPAIKSLWDYNDPAGTEKKFQELLPKVKQTGSKVYLGELVTQIARTHSLRGQFEEAKKVLNELNSWNLETYPTVLVRYYLENGRIYSSSGEKEPAAVEFQKAWSLATAEGLDYHAVDAAHMMVIASKELEDQIGWTEKAITLAEQSEDKDANNWLGALYNNVGWSYFDSKQYEKALEQFQKGLDWRVKNTTNAQGIFIAKWCIARTHRALGNGEKALEIQLLLEQEMKGTDNPDGYVYEELAELYWEKDQKDKAKSYYKLAYEQLSKDNWLVKNEPDRINKLKEKAGIE